jgi:hypothetical protein
MVIYHRLRKFPSDTVFVHGNAKTGADSIADEILGVLKREVEIYPALWKKYGKSAGPIRNQEMAEAGADLCLAFWDGKSKGTGNMIQWAMKLDIPVEIHYADGRVLYPEGTIMQEESYG